MTGAVARKSLEHVTAEQYRQSPISSEVHMVTFDDVRRALPAIGELSGSE